MPRVSEQQLASCRVVAQQERGRKFPSARTFEEAIVQALDKYGLIPIVRVFPQSVAQAFGDGTHAFTVTGDVGDSDARDRPLATDRQIIKIPAAGRWLKRPAADPGVQARQIRAVRGRPVAAPDLQARQLKDIA